MARALADDDPELQLSCNASFTNVLLHAMWGMKDRAEMTDFTIKLNNLTIPCHSVVIAAISDYFYTLLQRKEMREAKEQCVELQDMDEECLQRVVEYCYTGNINVQLSGAYSCLNIAHYLRIKPLLDQLEGFVSKNLRPDNVIGWYMRADKLQLQELLAASKALMLASLTDVVKHREFHQLTVTELQDYIAQKSNDADAVLDACVSWAQYNVEARCDNFMELLHCIQLENCSKAKLQTVLRLFTPSWPNYIDLQKELAWRIVFIPDDTATSLPMEQPSPVQEPSMEQPSPVQEPSMKQPSPVQDNIPSVTAMPPAGAAYTSHAAKTKVTATSVPATLSATASATATGMSPPSSSSSTRVNKLKVLVLGGYTDKHVLNRKLWKLDLTTGTCREVGKMAHYAVKYDAVYSSCKKGVLVVGGSKGFNDFDPTGECSILSVPGFTWSTAMSLRPYIAQATAVYVNELIYIFGGTEPDVFGDNEPENTVYCFNMNTMKWVRCPDMPINNILPIAGVVHEKVYVVFNTSEHNEEHRTGSAIPVHCFDSRKRKWSSQRSLPASVCSNTSDADMLNVKDALFMVGGMKRLCLKYSPNSDYWTVLKRPTLVQRELSAVHMNGKIVMVGGYDHDAEYHGTIQVYDIAANSWIIHGMRLPMALERHHCTVYDEDADEIVP